MTRRLKTTEYWVCWIFKVEKFLRQVIYVLLQQAWPVVGKVVSA